MKMKVTAIVKMTLGLATVVLMGSCVSNPDSSGLEYMPDMYRSPAIEPYVDYGQVRGRDQEELTLKQSAMTPPMNTIPFVGTDSTDVMMMLPYIHKANKAFKETHGMYKAELTEEDSYAASINDVNPLKLTAENSKEIMKTGKYLYSSKCMHCHGEKGDGNGPMVTSGAYAGVPAYTDRKEVTEGQIFYSIYYGKGAMGAHSSLLNKKEIWTLVHYVRQFQDPEYGKFNEDGSAAAPVAAEADSTEK